MNPSPQHRELMPPDRLASQRWLSAPSLMVSSSVLHHEVAKRMAQRMNAFRLLPQAGLDWHPSVGGILARDVFREAGLSVKWKIHETNPQRFAALKRQSDPWWRWRNGLQSAQEGAEFDLVWSNLGLHLTHQPHQWLKTWQKVLKPSGVVIFSCFGPDTLKELSEFHASQLLPKACQDWMDMHDWGDALLKNGWKDPVMDVERLTLTYQKPDDLIADMRAWGRNLHSDRFASCRSPNWLDRYKKALGQFIESAPDRCFRLTFEVIYGHAIRSDRVQTTSGVQTIALSELREQLKTPHR